MTKWKVLIYPHAIANFHMMIKSSSGGNAHTTLCATIIHYIVFLESVSIHGLLTCKPFMTHVTFVRLFTCMLA